MIVVAYGLILPQKILDIPTYGCWNVHASLLPRWRGAAPIQRAIMAGDAESGVCVMKMEAGLDTGPVAMVERLAIGPDTVSYTHLDVYKRQLHDIVEMFVQVGIDRFRGHEEQCDVLRFAGQEIALGDILHMHADIAAHALAGGLPGVVATGLAQQREALQREFGVDDEAASVAGQGDQAVRPLPVRELRLEGEEGGGQAVADDRFHPALAIGAARLLVGEHVPERCLLYTSRCV